MHHIYANFSGMAIALLSWIAGVALTSDPWGFQKFCVSGLLMVMADLVYRHRFSLADPDETRPYHVPIILPDAGGHIMFIPVWILGLLCAVYGGCRIYQQRPLVLPPGFFVPEVKGTDVSIVGEAFYINDQPTYAGRSWNGKNIEGLLKQSGAIEVKC